MFRWRGVFIAALTFGILGTGCYADRKPISVREQVRVIPERVVVSDGWLAMGTFFEVDLRVGEDSVPAARAWLDWARGEVVRLEAIYSKYAPEGEVS